jgi:hypothetical protein
LNTTCDALSLQLRAGHAGSKLILFTNHLWNYIDGWQPSLARPETLKEHILLFNIVWFHKHHTRSARTERKQKGWNDTVRSFRWWGSHRHAAVLRLRAPLPVTWCEFYTFI